jgi:hypothetical protein
MKIGGALSRRGVQIAVACGVQIVNPSGVDGSSPAMSQ